MVVQECVPYDNGLLVQKNEGRLTPVGTAMDSTGDFPTWYKESLKTTVLWTPCQENTSACLTKVNGTTFLFRKDTTFSLKSTGKTGYFRVTGFMDSKETAAAAPRGPAGIYFVEWDGTQWIYDQGSPFEYRPMACFPGGAGRRGFVVDWNSVEPWTVATVATVASVATAP